MSLLENERMGGSWRGAMEQLSSWLPQVPWEAVMSQVLSCVCELDSDLTECGFPSHLDYFLSPNSALSLQSHFAVPSSYCVHMYCGHSDLVKPISAPAPPYCPSGIFRIDTQHISPVLLVSPCHLSLHTTAALLQLRPVTCTSSERSWALRAFASSIASLWNILSLLH